MSEEALYPPGTIVQLRSGGPHLTVVKSLTLVHVAYYSEVTGKFEELTVPEACLRAASQQPHAPENAYAMRHQSVAKSSMS